MLVPVRCFTCGALVADKYEEFTRRKTEGENPVKIFKDLHIDRYCCRRMMLSSMDVVDEMLPYYEGLARRRKEFE